MGKLLLLLMLPFLLGRAAAVIDGGDYYLFDFANEESRARIHGVIPQVLTSAGIVCPSDNPTSVTFTLDPLPLGMAWRPLNKEVHPRVSLLFRDEAGGVAVVVEARFSTDKVHWSPWQRMRIESMRTDRLSVYTAKFLVQPLDRSALYDELYYKWMDENTCDDDQDEFIRWVLVNHPNTLANHIPLIGWAGIRVSFRGPPGTTLRAVQYDDSWMTGGVHQGCKGTAVSRASKWYFNAANPGAAPVEFSPRETVRSWIDDQNVWHVDIPRIDKLATSAEIPQTVP